MTNIPRTAIVRVLVLGGTTLLAACSSESGGSASPGGGAGTQNGGTGNGGGASGNGGGQNGGANNGGGQNGGANNGGSSGRGGGTGGRGNTGGSQNTGGIPNVGPVQDAGDPGATDVTFDVRANQNVHAISPWVYGTNEAQDLANNHQTVIRLGGNRWTAYNWENNASNAGSDYLYQNDGLISQDNTPAKPVVDAIKDANSHGAATVMTIPIVDYVSADKNGGGDVRNSGSNYLSTRFKQNKPAKGSTLGAPDGNDAFVYEDEFVNTVKGSVGNATVFLSMDNEPDLWSSTHAEVHPNPVTYAELWTRNHDYAKAAKAAWPGVPVLGFVSYGFNGYVNLQNASDGNGRDFIEWYLDQAKAAESADGRLIDYLDLHWYPEAQGGGQRIIGEDTSADSVTAREQAPRSLWDSTYTEDSWVAGYLGNQPIDLLHWLGAKVDGHYPGTKLSFTEWNYGGGAHISGAIAVADVLGVYGRESVGLATYWPLHSDESFAYAGFRVYRNYDGQGSAFGDTSIAATSSDVPTATVYASIDSGNTKRTVIVAINKATSTKTAGIVIAHSASYQTASVWTLTGGSTTLTAGAALTAVGTNAFRYDMPAQSVSIIVPAE